jgi:hypothetical protein
MGQTPNSLIMMGHFFRYGPELGNYHAEEHVLRLRFPTPARARSGERHSSGNHLLLAAAAGLVLLNYMLPRKRGSEAGEVQDFNKPLRAEEH